MIATALAAALPEILVRIVVATMIAVATTAISMRLLGIRRGWSTALLAGVIGWGIAGILALGLAGWDWGTDDLVLHMLAIGIPATMATAVMLDLLARPGSLARGEQAGLVVAPQPLRAIGTRIEVFRRYRELLRIARQEGFGPFISAGARAEHATEGTGARLRRVLEQAGGVYIKLGQIAATRVDLLPPEICVELGKLQNRVAPEPIELIKPAIEAEIGGEVESVFAAFDWEPLAAASVSQTYRARLHTGEEVVVKVQRPGIEAIMQRDLAALALLANFAQSRTEVGQGLRTGELLDEFAKGLRAELDFRREAEAMTEMTTSFGASGSVQIPEVYPKLCTRRLLVQERFEGFTLADTGGLASSDLDRPELGGRLMRCFLEQVLRDGFFHADPHPGNVFVFSDGGLGLIDFGAVGRLDPIQQAAVRDMLVALATRNVSLLRDAIERVADVAPAGSPDQLERALARLMAENVRASGVVSPSVLQDLVATLSRFGIRLPGDLVVLSRAMVTLDGTLRVISPELNVISTAGALMGPESAEPVLDSDALIRDELLAVLPHLRRLPDRIDRVLSLTGRGELRIRSIVDEDDQRILRTLVNRALLSFVGFALLLIGTLLLVAGDAGPVVAGGTGLFEIFGYGGLLAGMVLVLRVVAAVARDGTT